MVRTIKITGYYKTDTGKVRPSNEDRLCVVPFFDCELGATEIIVDNNKAMIFAIADGMGGNNAGEVAATIAIETVKDSAERIEIKNLRPTGIRNALESIILQAHLNIKKAINDENAGMGTTLILVLISGNSLYVAWCGDSRAYKYSHRIMERKNKYDLPNLKILSHDHSVVWQMVRRGKLDPNAAREHELSNVITQSLGDPKNVPKPDTATYTIAPGDKILICSDGLNSMIPDEFIQELLSHEESVEALSNSLIEAANRAGGYDNISLILMQIDAVPESSPSVMKSVKERPEAITAKSGLGESKNRRLSTWKELKLNEIVLIVIFISAIALIPLFISTISKSGVRDRIEEKLPNQNINTDEIDTPQSKNLTDSLPRKEMNGAGENQDTTEKKK